MMDRLAKFGADLGLGAPTGLGLNGEEGGFLPTEEWYREQKRKNPKAEGFQIGQARERRHRPGVDARDAAADGDAVRGDRQRRQAVAAADRRARRVARRARCWRSSRRACAASWRCRPRRWRSCARRWSASSTSPRGPRTRRASRTSRWRARPAPRRCRAGHAERRLRGRRRTPGSSASRPPGGRRSRSRCWSSTAATAATSRRRWRWRSSTTTSRPSRPADATRPTSGCRAAVRRARAEAPPGDAAGARRGSRAPRGRPAPRRRRPPPEATP